MEFTFRTKYPTAIYRGLSRVGISDYEVDKRKDGALVLLWANDRFIREVYQWAAAAFACGLIESPRIERM